MRSLLRIAFLLVITLGLRYPFIGMPAFYYMGLMILMGKRRKWRSFFCSRCSLQDVMISRLSPIRPLPLRMLSKAALGRLVLALFPGLLRMEPYMSGLFGPWPEDDLNRLRKILARLSILSSTMAQTSALWKNRCRWFFFCTVGIRYG